MMASKLAVFLAANLLFLAAVHGACLYCPGSPVIPTPPGFPTPPGTPVPPGSPAPPTGGAYCPINALTLGVCANVLNLLRLNIGVPPTEQCCPLLQGLVDLEAAVCLCIAIRANILGINLNLPIDLTLLLNYCGNGVPPGFTCPV